MSFGIVAKVNNFIHSLLIFTTYWKSEFDCDVKTRIMFFVPHHLIEACLLMCFYVRGIHMVHCKLACRQDKQQLASNYKTCIYRHFRLEAIKEQVKAKNMEEAAEKEGRPPLKRLERQILTETLRFEQEKIQLLRETAKMEKEKLAMDVKLAEISIEKAKFELELLKRRRLT